MDVDNSGLIIGDSILPDIFTVKYCQDLGRDAIVILSTHIVSDVEHIADRILMMKDGSIVFDGQAADIQGDLETFYLKTFGGEDE